MQESVAEEIIIPDDFVRELAPWINFNTLFLYVAHIYNIVINTFCLEHLLQKCTIRAVERSGAEPDRIPPWEVFPVAHSKSHQFLSKLLFLSI